jgi:hypothetical protein
MGLQHSSTWFITGCSTGFGRYAATAGATRRALRDHSGKQPGDAVRAANAIIQATESPAPPLHLLLGRDALQMAREKLEALRGAFDTWEKVTETFTR